MTTPENTPIRMGGSSDYIREMRQKIGHAPLIVAGAAVLIFDKCGRLLMMRRTDIGSWGIPGGAMEPGERLAETAARETLEETGLLVSDLTLFDVFSGPELIFQYPNGDVTCNVSAVYSTHTARGQIVLNTDEHTEWRCFPLDQLPVDISPPIRCVLDAWIARAGGNPSSESVL